MIHPLPLYALLPSAFTCPTLMPRRLDASHPYLCLGTHLSVATFPASSHLPVSTEQVGLCLPAPLLSQTQAVAIKLLCAICCLHIHLKRSFTSTYADSLRRFNLEPEMNPFYASEVRGRKRLRAQTSTTRRRGCLKLDYLSVKLAQGSFA